MPTDPQGTLIFNGLSFSGADIKAVIHTYGDPRGQDWKGLAKERQVQLELDAIRTQLQQISAQIQSINAAPPATQASRAPELSLLLESQDRLQAVEADLHSLIQTLAALREGDPGAHTLSPTKVLAEIQTLSVSTHREKYPVRALGSVYPRGFTRGPRTIAGSMVMTVFNQHILHSILETDPGDTDRHPTTALIDQLPPFDITIAFANEYGEQARMAILGCEFVNEGQVMSIEDLLLESELQYVARDLDPMRRGARRPLDPNSIEASRSGGGTASELLFRDAYKEYSRALNPWARKRFDRFV